MRLQASTLLEIAKALHVPETKWIEIERKYCSVSIVSEEEFFKIILTIGDSEGKLSQAEEIVLGLEERIAIIKHKLKFINESTKPSVLCLTNLYPPSIEDNQYLTTIIKIAGGKTYDVKRTEEEEERLNPDVLMVLANPMERLFEDLPELLSLDEWKSSKAVKNNAIFLLEGKNHFQGFGLQVADDIESLAEILYPQQLTYGGNGDTWIQFEV